MMTNWTLTTSGACVAKAGKNVNSEISTSGAILTIWKDEAEGRIVAETRRDWVDQYASVDAGTQTLLGDVCSSMIAIKLINYDMGGYTSKTEAQTMLDVNDDIVQRGMNVLRDFKSNTIKPV